MGARSWVAPGAMALIAAVTLSACGGSSSTSTKRAKQPAMPEFANVYMSPPIAALDGTGGDPKIDVAADAGMPMTVAWQTGSGGGIATEQESKRWKITEAVLGNGRADRSLAVARLTEKTVVQADLDDRGRLTIDVGGTLHVVPLDEIGAAESVDAARSDAGEVVVAVAGGASGDLRLVVVDSTQSLSEVTRVAAVAGAGEQTTPTSVQLAVTPSWIVAAWYGSGSPVQLARLDTSFKLHGTVVTGDEQASVVRLSRSPDGVNVMQGGGGTLSATTWLDADATPGATRTLERKLPCDSTGLPVGFVAMSSRAVLPAYGAGCDPGWAVHVRAKAMPLRGKGSARIAEVFPYAVTSTPDGALVVAGPLDGSLVAVTVSE